MVSLAGAEGFGSVGEGSFARYSIQLLSNPKLASSIALANTRFAIDSLAIRGNPALQCVPDEWPAMDMDGHKITHGSCLSTSKPTTGFLTYVQLPYVALVVVLAIMLSGALYVSNPYAWCRQRPVEIALKVFAPPLLVLGAWVPLAFKVSDTDPFGVALVASVLLRIVMFTNKVHTMQKGGTDLWSSPCWILLAVSWLSLAGVWAMMAAYAQFLPTMYVDSAPYTARCDFLRPLQFPSEDGAGLCLYSLLLAAHCLV
jgi:hypothetical protein